MRDRISSLLIGPLLVLAAFAASCSTSPSGPRARATIEAKSGSGVSGTASFGEKDGALVIVMDVTGVPPSGFHGVHIHQVGDCSAADGGSAGAHFNPFGAAHGGPASAQHHAGDLGNITIRNDGSGHLEIRSTALTISSGQGAVVNRAIVLHAGQDDFTTQPTGNSGGRIGCGVIRLQ